MNNITMVPIEQQLNLKTSINLPPKERLALLLKAERYPIVKKLTSAEKQIKEMIDFYNLLCLITAKYFPNEQADYNFLLLNIISSQENAKHTTSNELQKAFQLLNNYEALEKKITAIQNLFYEYEKTFPDIYNKYNLEGIVMQDISDIIEHSRRLLIDKPSYSKELLSRWCS